MGVTADAGHRVRNRPLARTLAVYHRLARVRDRAALPVTGALVRAGVSADLLSVLSVAVMVPVVLVAGSMPWLAAACILASTMLDQLDGAVARYRGRTSDRGKLVDVVCDNLAFTCYLLGLAAAGLVGPVVAVLVVYTMVVSKVLRLAVHSFDLQSAWLFRPVAGFLPNAAVAVMYLVYLPHALAGDAPFALAGTAVAAVLALDALVHLSRLLQARAGVSPGGGPPGGEGRAL